MGETKVSHLFLPALLTIAQMIHQKIMLLMACIGLPMLSTIIVRSRTALPTMTLATGLPMTTTVHQSLMPAIPSMNTPTSTAQRQSMMRQEILPRIPSAMLTTMTRKTIPLYVHSCDCGYKGSGQPLEISVVPIKIDRGGCCSD